MATIQNLIVTAQMNCEFNLPMFPELIPGAKYNASRFSAARVHFDAPIKTTLLVFKNGRVVCTGTKSIDNAKVALQHFCKLAGDNVQVDNIRIKNVVASYDLGHMVDVNMFYNNNRSSCVYEPELFPALKLKIFTPTSLVVLIFHSGKIILTGSASINLTQRSLSRILNMLAPYYIQ